MKFGSSLLLAVPGLRHAFFTREGGVSNGIYASLNGGVGSKDDPAHVAENRRRMAEELKVQPTHFLTAYPGSFARRGGRDRAVGYRVTPSRRCHGDQDTSASRSVFLRPIAGRSCSSIHRRVSSGPRTPAGRARSAACLNRPSAPWKGSAPHATASSPPIGPLIRQQSYEVGAEFVTRFTEADADNAAFFVPSSRANHSMFDLAGYIRQRLERAGILMIDDVDVCTYDDERMFSYRRSVHRQEPDYGRNIHAIVLDD